MMIPFADIRDRVLEGVSVGPVNRVDLADADRRILSGDVVTRYDFPLFDNSAMDGFAVRSADFDGGPRRFRVVGVSSAGHPFDGELGPGEVARILTGAPTVVGCDSVIPVEASTFDPVNGTVEFTAIPSPGDHIRRRGEILESGSLVLASGTVINPGYLGVLAAHGIAAVDVVSPPTVAILSTGDELVSSKVEPGPGQIFESNIVVVETLLNRLGCATRVVHARDDRESIEATLSELSSSVDIIISTGGVSMGGDYDALRNAAVDFDVEVVQVAMKPAKPFAFGRVGDALFFGLPGNPGSVLVSFESFVRPAVRKWSGIAPSIPATVRGVTGTDLSHADDGKAHFIPMQRGADGSWVTVGAIRSHSIDSIADADALLRMEADQLFVSSGTEVELSPLWD